MNWLNAKAAGLLRGGYHFLTWTTDPVIQANYYWSIIKNDPGELPLVVDFEWWSTIPSTALDILKRYLEQLKKLAPGRKIMIYTARAFWQQYGSKDPYWKQYLLWEAFYSVVPPAPFEPFNGFTFWQYTSHGDGLYYGMESKER